MASASEAEIAALFHNGKEACPIRTLLEELGHPQPATPIVTDNKTAMGIATTSIKQKQSKAMDMRFYWIRDRVRQGQFKIYWQRGETNRADYFSKHHNAATHKQSCDTYLLPKPSTNRYAALDDGKRSCKGVLIPQEYRIPRQSRFAKAFTNTSKNILHHFRQP